MRKFLVILSYLYLLSVSASSVPLPEPFGSIPRVIIYLFAPLGLIFIVYHKKTAKYPLSLYMAFLFMTWSMFTGFWSYDPESTLAMIYQLLTYIVPFLLIYEFLRSENQVVRGLAFFSFGAYGICAHILYNFINGIHFNNIPDRYSGLFLDANVVAIFLSIQSCVAMHLVAFSPQALGRWKSAFAFLPVVSLICSVMTGSRAAVVIWIIPIVYAIILLRASPRWKDKMVVALIILVTSLLATYTQQPLEKQYNRIRTITTSFAIDKFNDRIPVWEAGLAKFAERPILGVGFGAYQKAIESSYAVTPGSGSLRAHNTLLSLLTETGLIGFSLFLSMFASLVASFKVVPREVKRLWTAVFFCWIIGSSAVSFELSEFTWILILLAMLSSKYLVSTETPTKAFDRLNSRHNCLPTQV